MAHYESVLKYHSSAADCSSLHATSQSTVPNGNTNTDSSAIKDMLLATKMLKNEKAAGLDGITRFAEEVVDQRKTAPTFLEYGNRESPLQNGMMR